MSEYWTPILSEKQVEIFNTGVSEDAEHVHPEYPTSLLVSGARKTGKTLGVCHRVCRHLWETQGARVALLSKTIRSMTDGGIWQDLVELIMPEWIESGIGFEFTTKDSTGLPGPKTDAKTRTIYFKVRNMWGGESELRLLSLEHDQQVKSKLKNSRYSMIWFSELSLFKDPKVFQVAMMQLRMVHLKPWQHMWISDTNPAEEGEDHWAYRLWYLRKPSDDKEALFLKSTKLIEVFLEDNPFLTQGEIDFQKSLYGDDPGEYDREVLGKWTAGHGNKGLHFADKLIEGYHIVGGGPDEGDQIDVHPSTNVLYCGWDLGQVNHAAVILEKRLFLVNGQEYSLWNVLDALLYVGDRVSIREFAVEFLEKMDAISDRWKRRFEFIHYSDDSATNVWRPSGASFDYLEVQIATNNRINLIGVNKPEGSVQVRVQLLRRLLHEKRIFISSRCDPVIEMLRRCAQGTTQKEYVKGDRQKHTFDALTYPIFMECAFELDMQATNPVVQASREIVTV